jgi:uncharacterized protein with GYD domain
MTGDVKKSRTLSKNDEITYFFLIKHTEQGVRQSAAQKKQGINAVTQAVLKEKGKCTLYSTRGAAYDYVSVMTGISTAGAVRIAAAIESRGTVRATMLSGVLLVNVGARPASAR